MYRQNYAFSNTKTSYRYYKQNMLWDVEIFWNIKIIYYMILIIYFKDNGIVEQSHTLDQKTAVILCLLFV